LLVQGRWLPCDGSQYLLSRHHARLSQGAGGGQGSFKAWVVSHDRPPGLAPSLSVALFDGTAGFPPLASARLDLQFPEDVASS